MMRRGVWRLVASAGVVAALVSPVARSGVRGRAMWSWSRLEEDEGGQSLVGSGSVSSELRAKIEEYLSVRSSRLAKERTMREKRVAEREAATSNAVWRAGNALFSLESLLPEVPEDDGENEALAYTELERFGYSGLVEEIMDAGGHVAVSRALGIRVRGRAEPVVPEAPEPRLEPSRGLALGASRDARLDGVATMNVTRVKEEAARARERREQPTPRREPSALNVRRVPPPSVDPPAPSRWPLLLAPFSLGVLGRLYGVLALFALSLRPDASATLQAKAALAPVFAGADALFDAAHDLAFAFLAANAAAVVVSVVAGSDRPVFAAARAAFAGPFAILEDRSSSGAARDEP